MSYVFLILMFCVADVRSMEDAKFTVKFSDDKLAELDSESFFCFYQKYPVIQEVFKKEKNDMYDGVISFPISYDSYGKIQKLNSMGEEVARSIVQNMPSPESFQLLQELSKLGNDQIIYSLFKSLILVKFKDNYGFLPVNQWNKFNVELMNFFKPESMSTPVLSVSTEMPFQEVYRHFDGLKSQPTNTLIKSWFERITAYSYIRAYP